jgi:hypothetical protein
MLAVSRDALLWILDEENRNYPDPICSTFGMTSVSVAMPTTAKRSPLSASGLVLHKKP